MSKQTGYQSKGSFVNDVDRIRQAAEHYNNKMAEYNANTKTADKSSKIAAAGHAVEQKLSRDLSNAETKFTDAIDEKGKIQDGKDSLHNESLQDMTKVAKEDANNLKKLTKNSEFRASDQLDNIADFIDSKAEDTHEKMKQIPGEGDDYSRDRGSLPVIDWDKGKIAFRNKSDIEGTGYAWRALQPGDVEYYQQLGGKVPQQYYQQNLNKTLWSML